MLKDMKAAAGAAGRVEERINKPSLQSVASVWGKRLLLTGMILASSLVAEKAYSVTPNTSTKAAAQTPPIVQRISTSHELAERLAAEKGMGILLRDKEVLVRFCNQPIKSISRSEFNEAVGQLKKEGVNGTMTVYLAGLTENGSKRLQKDLAGKGEDGLVMLHSEKINLGKILDLTDTKFSLREAMKFFREGKYDDLINFDHSKCPKEAIDYIENLGRKHYKSYLLRVLMSHEGDTMNKGITSEERGKFQALATKIVKSEYGEKEVTPKEAAIAINNWISNNISYEGKYGIPALRTFQNAVTIISLGKGTCTDMSNIFDVLCNSIGIPARMVFIGEKNNWRNKWIGGGFHTVAEVYFEKEGWVVFDPTNRCYVTDEYYTRTTYFRVLPMLTDKVNPEDIIWNVSKPIKE